jgi:hypothetical protein
LRWSSLLLLVALLGTLFGPIAEAAAAPPVGEVGTAPTVADLADSFEVQLLDLAAVRRLFQALARLRPTMSEGERIAAWTELTAVTEAVAGDTAVGLPRFDEVLEAVTRGVSPRVRATRGVAGRDGVAYLMLAVGYSARETADVVSGRIDRPSLDMAQRMILAGLGRDVAADYLDDAYARVRALRDAEKAPPETTLASFVGPFDQLIERYANMHAVEAALVRAIIQVESAFNPAARSRVGAIGLMQLMPSTAQELGVNPFIPEQNIEGGVRYFSQMLKKFGSIDLALVAYNAGPGFAERYLRGQAALYGETRDYVNNVLAKLSQFR